MSQSRVSINARISIAAFVLAGVAGGAHGQSFAFAEVGAARGIQPYIANEGQTSGASAADYDNDGDIDLFVPTHVYLPDQLYRNLGDGTFEEIGQTAGVGSVRQNRQGLFIDLEGDGDLDLFVIGDCRIASGGLTGCANVQPYTIYEQTAPSVFTEITATAGLTQPALNAASHVGGAAAGDVNGDGILDVYICYWEGFNYLYLGNGDGTFTNVTATSGINIYGNDHYWTPMMFDFDGDGDLDIYQARDFDENMFWENQGDGTFIDIAPFIGLDNAMNDMGMSLGDFDNDQDVDIYITNISDSVEHPGHNILLRNDSIGAALNFSEIATQAGCERGYWGWGNTMFDCDNDGWLDIVATNGWGGLGGSLFANDPTRFYHNNQAGPGWFTEMAAAIGLNDTYWGSCIIAADFDRDGDMDLVQTTMNDGPLRLLENDAAATQGHNYVVVRPRMLGPNTHAIGATVRITAGGLNQMRVITAGVSQSGQEPAEAHFGLGTATIVDSLTVEWPGGATSTLTNVTPNQIIDITPECFGDVTGNGTVDIQDLNAVLGNFGTSGPSGDVNGDNSVDIADLNAVLGNFGRMC